MIRRLFFAPRVVVLVSTIGISGLAVAIVTAYPEITDFGATYPPAVDNTWSDVLGVRVTGAQLAVLVVVPIVAFALGWFLNRTLVGRTVKASAENPDLARVQGINPKLVSTAVWSIAGFVATLTMMLVAADNGGAARDLLTLGPNTLGARTRRGRHRGHGVVPPRDARGGRHRRRASTGATSTTSTSPASSTVCCSWPC